MKEEKLLVIWASGSPHMCFEVGRLPVSHFEGAGWHTGQYVML